VHTSATVGLSEHLTVAVKVDTVPVLVAASDDTWGTQPEIPLSA
jgi:hypothetical protein